MFKKIDKDGVEWTLRRCSACYAAFKYPSHVKDVCCPECTYLHNRSKPGPSIQK